MKVYENVLIPLLGKAKLFIPMANSKRNVNDNKESIYVWKKILILFKNKGGLWFFFL